MHLFRPALTHLFLLAAAIGTAHAAPDARTRERDRLAAATDRDSRIAAALLSLPSDGTSPPSEAEARAALAALEPLRDDALALYVAALVCQLNAACGDPTAAERLTRHAPDNALHWLLPPGTAALSDTALQRAAESSGAAEPHLSELLALLRRTLDGVTNRLTTDDRDAALAAIPLPRLAPLLEACKAATGARRDDCLVLGQRLFADARGSLLTRMVGSVLLRRLVPDSTQAQAATALRRDYVWLGEHAVAQRPDDALYADIERYGEWEALLRAADRAGVARTPPPDWTPRDPQQLLLPEQRSVAAPGKG